MQQISRILPYRLEVFRLILFLLRALLLSFISIFGFSSLNLCFNTRVSASILSPLEPIINPGLSVETIIFSPIGVYSTLIELTLPFPRLFQIYLFIAYSFFLNCTNFFSSILFVLLHLFIFSFLLFFLF